MNYTENSIPVIITVKKWFLSSLLVLLWAHTHVLEQHVRNAKYHEMACAIKSARMVTSGSDVALL